MAKLRATNIDPKTATTLTLGASGDSVTFASTEIRANTLKDAGGNTLWTSNGTGTVSSVNSALSGGGWTKISSNTIASGTTTFNITTGLDTTYPEYIFIINDFMGPDGVNTRLMMNFTSDGGTTMLSKTSVYGKVAHYQGGSGGAFHELGNNAYSLRANTAYQPISDTPINFTGTNSSAWKIHLYGNNETTYYKFYRVTGAYMQNGSSGSQWFEGPEIVGRINATTTINSFHLQMESGNMRNGIVDMYGIA